MLTGGVEKALELMVQHAPDETNETNETNWPKIRNDVRQYVQSCSACPKMDARHKTIRASRFVFSTLKPMERIAIDNIGPLPNDMGFKYIIVIIDTFTRYVELSLNKKFRPLPRLMPFGVKRVNLPHL